MAEMIWVIPIDARRGPFSAVERSDIQMRGKISEGVAVDERKAALWEGTGPAVRLTGDLLMLFSGKADERGALEELDSDKDSGGRDMCRLLGLAVCVFSGASRMDGFLGDNCL